LIFKKITVISYKITLEILNNTTFVSGKKIDLSGTPFGIYIAAGDIYNSAKELL
jgi:hypothetical protein